MHPLKNAWLKFIDRVSDSTAKAAKMVRGAKRWDFISIPEGPIHLPQFRRRRLDAVRTVQRHNRVRVVGKRRSDNPPGGAVWTRFAKRALARMSERDFAHFAIPKGVIRAEV